MPDRSVARPSALAAPGGVAWDDDLPRPARMLSRPTPVEVIALLPDDAPRTFTWRGRRFAVTLDDGPKRLQGEWWWDGRVEGERP